MKKEIEDYLKELAGNLTGISYSDPAIRGGFDLGTREGGGDWPATAVTMVGTQRLENLRWISEEIIDNNIEGDFVETGVWRGGVCIYMAALFKAMHQNDRKVWVCDSFEGLPPANPEKYPADAGDPHYGIQELAIPLEDVKHNFDRYGVLDDNVKFIKGFFKDTMPTIEVEKIAILRLDGDMYESTIDVLDYLYPRLSVGGYCIIDDYGLPNCAAAVNDYREKHGITDEMTFIAPYKSSLYWKKSA
jgi:O-methyltransferase